MSSQQHLKLLWIRPDPKASASRRVEATVCAPWHAPDAAVPQPALVQRTLQHPDQPEHEISRFRTPPKKGMRSPESVSCEPTSDPHMWQRMGRRKPVRKTAGTHSVLRTLSGDQGVASRKQQRPRWARGQMERKSELGV